MTQRRGSSLSPRQERVLAAVVEEHIRTAAPVGSLAVRERYERGVSTATIRNDMSELEARGFISQPHTSAGRVPRQSAYRFYVDRVLERELPVSREWAWALGEFRRARRDVETVLRASTRLLSEVTRRAAVASAPARPGPAVVAVGLRPVSAQSVRIRVELSDGSKHEGLLRLRMSLTAEQIAALGARLSNSAAGEPLDRFAKLAGAVLGDLVEDRMALAEILERAKQATVPLAQHVYVDGTVHILEQPEFTAREKLTALLAALDEETVVRRVLHSAVAGQGDVLVAIGTENEVLALNECSLVAKTYRVGQERVGAVGVLGPMRMPYREVIATVRTVADRVGQLLSDVADEAG